MNRGAQILVSHRDDEWWPDVQERISLFASLGYIRPTVLLRVARGGEMPVDPPVSIIGGCSGGHADQSTTLLSYLATLEAVDRVTTVAIHVEPSTSQIGSAIADDLDHAMGAISQVLIRYATSASHHEIRLALLEEGEEAPRAPFFSSSATANVVVLPRDISMNRAVARPILRDNRETFLAHSATEICSTLGLWAAMNEGPLDNFQSRPMGTRGFQVHLVSSRVKGLLAPPLPVGELLDDSSSLPLPRGFSPVDNPRMVVENYAEAIYPANLVFEPIERPRHENERRNWRELGQQYLQEFARVARQLPVLLRSGIQGEVDAVGSNWLDRLLGGADAQVRPIVPRQSSDETPIITAELIEELIDSIEQRDGRPIATSISTEDWTHLIEAFFAIADGNDEYAAVRDRVLPPSLLVGDKASLAPNTSSIGDTIREIMPPTPSNVVMSKDAEPTIVEQAIQDAGEDGPSNEDGTDQPEGPEPEDMQAEVESTSMVSTGELTFGGDIDLEVLREAVRQSSLSSPVAATELSEIDGQVDSYSIEIDRSPTTLLGFLTRRFDREFRKAEDSTIESLAEIRGIPALFGRGYADKVSWTVPFAIALSISGIFISLATHGIFRDVLSMDWVSRRNRDFIWTSLTTIVLVASVGALIGAGRRAGQAKALVIASVCAGILALEYVAFDSLRNAVLSSGRGQADASAAIFIFVGTLAVTIAAIRRNRAISDPIHVGIARLLLLVLWAYTTLSLASFVAGPESFIISWTDSTRHRALIAVQFVSWISLLMACVVLVSYFIRQRNIFGRYQREFDWAQRNLVQAIDARRYLRVAYTQWLVLAGAISRTVWSPLGQSAPSGESFDGDLSGDESILKFDLAQIELTGDGRVALLAQLKQKFVRQGWLNNQFDTARHEYQERTRFITGNDEGDHDPIACSAAPSLDSLLIDEGHGDRVGFVRQILDGSFDKTLLGEVTAENRESVYADLLGNERMHRVTQSQNHFKTGYDFMADIVPTQVAYVPPRVLSRLTVAGDESTVMQSHLWWPQSPMVSAPPPGTASVVRGTPVQPEGFDESVILMTVLVDVSKGFADSDLHVTSEGSGPTGSSGTPPLGSDESPNELGD